MNQHDESSQSGRGPGQSEQGSGGIGEGGGSGQVGDRPEPRVPSEPAGAQEPGAPSGPAVTAEGAPNLIQRVIAVFTAPVKLGEWIRRDSPWFWTLAIVAAVSAVIVMLMPSDLLMQAAQAPMAEQGGGAPQPSVGMVRGLGLAGALVGTFVGAALVAGILYITFNLIFGQSQITYKNQLSATAHVWWITLLGALIALPLQLAREDLQLKLGLGLLLPEEPSSFVGYLLDNITLFGLWASVALGAVESGLSEGKVSVGKAATTVLALYLIVAVAMASFRTMVG